MAGDEPIHEAWFEPNPTSDKALEGLEAGECHDRICKIQRSLWLQVEDGLSGAETRDRPGVSCYSRPDQR